MKKVTLRFQSLQAMADCMYQLGLLNPHIDYELCQLTANLTGKQIEVAKECQADVVEIVD